MLEHARCHPNRPAVNPARDCAECVLIDQQIASEQATARVNVLNGSLRALARIRSSFFRRYGVTPSSTGPNYASPLHAPLLPESDRDRATSLLGDSSE